MEDNRITDGIVPMVSEMPKYMHGQRRESVKVRIRRLDESAAIPHRAHPTDAGLDLTAVRVENADPLGDSDIWECGCGLAFEIPEGYVGLLFPRSSVYKTGAVLTNCVGVIDSGYRGEVKAKFRSEKQPYGPGDKFAQLVVIPYPEVEIEETSELSDSDRGEGGFGSSGK